MGGGRFFIENPRRGVSTRGWGRGAGRVSAANRGIGGGGGAKYFFSGPKCPPSFLPPQNYAPIPGLGTTITVLDPITQPTASLKPNVSPKLQPLIGADFWAGDPTKHFSVKRKGFSVKRGEGFSE